MFQPLKPVVWGFAVPVSFLMLAGCGPREAEVVDGFGQVGAKLQDRYGFVSIVDGTMGVIDLETMLVVNRVKESHRASHMLYSLPDSNEVIYGDWDTNDVLVLRFSDDMKSYEVAERAHSPVQMHGFFTLPPNDRYIVVTSRVELRTSKLPGATQDDESIAIFDRETKQWRTTQLQSPSHAELGPDGMLYVANVHHKNVSVVDPATLQEVQRVQVGPEQWVTGEESIGPKGIAFSPDGKTMVTADYEALTLSVFDMTANGVQNQRLIDVGGATKSVSFSVDGKELWVVTYDLNISREELAARAGTLPTEGDWYEAPQPANEALNAFMKTTMHVYDTQTWEEIDSFTTQRGMISPRMTRENPDAVYVTTAAGSVYHIDRATKSILGEAVVGRVGLPVICGHMAH